MRIHVCACHLTGDAVKVKPSGVQSEMGTGILLPHSNMGGALTQFSTHKLGGVVLWMPDGDLEAYRRTYDALTAAVDLVPGAWVDAPPRPPRS